ncbi:hypothetical protein [Streptomyces sp. RB17]|nr:hypothetical protein [Streptomyces sp. RB17]
MPVVLPTEAIEQDVFRRTHAHATFSCGLLLGGCGDAGRSRASIR